MKTTKTVTIRLNADLLERIDAVADNRSKFFCEAAMEKLNPVKLDAELTDQEKRNVIKGAKNLSDMMQDLIFRKPAGVRIFSTKWMMRVLHDWLPPVCRKKRMTTVILNMRF